MSFGFSISDKLLTSTKLKFIRKGEVKFNIYESRNIRLGTIAVNAGDVIFIYETDSQVFFRRRHYNTIYIASSSNGTYAKYAVFNSNLKTTQSEYGLIIRDENQNIVFSSEEKYLKPAKVIQSVNHILANGDPTHGYYSYDIPKGKTYGVLLKKLPTSYIPQPMFLHQSIGVVNHNIICAAVGEGLDVLPFGNASFSPRLAGSVKLLTADLTGYV